MPETKKPATILPPAPAPGWHLEWTQVAALAAIIAGVVVLAVFAPAQFGKLLELLGHLDWPGIVGAVLVVGGVGASATLPQILRRITGGSSGEGGTGGGS